MQWLKDTAKTENLPGDIDGDNANLPEDLDNPFAE